ncbi:flavodoxin family protein [Psychrilyobacter atlanticus]|uniref:flavodoxin family protein n=1 Tax=Psychrilyobacter atlanticus TaxID=271091 RepID=UPI0003F818A7|nr:flavodoxin family protein [Psychrilyobacter atlanticus]
MKTLIAYSSKTGNTKKVAESILKAFPKGEISDIKDIDNLDYDLIIVGTWIDKGTADAKALKFIETIKEKKIAYFFTLGAYPNSDHANDCIKNIDKLFLDNKNTLIGNFHCQGAIDPKLISWMSELPAENPLSASKGNVQRWKEAAKHPDEKDFENAYNYFKMLV